MVDAKISELDAIAAIAGEDLFAAVDDPSGTPATTKATITQLATFLAANTTTLTNHSIDWTDNTMAFTSAEILAACSDETGTGLLVFATSPTFITPALGTPASGDLSNCSGFNTFAAVVKSADETVNASTTLQNDDELLFTPTINKIYSYMLTLLVNATAVANIKYAFTVPSGATMISQTGGMSSSSAQATTDVTSAVTVSTNDGTDRVLRLYGRIVMSSTAGNVQLQWAQSVSEATDAKILKGSALIVWEG